MPKSNRNVDFFLMGSEFEIELGFAVSQLSDYLSELDALEAGAPYSELGISSRRHSQLPSIITISADSPRSISDPDALRNPDATPEGSFARLKLSGVMRSNDGLSTRGITSLAEDIRYANQNPNIIGILIEANTGGGESTAGDILKASIQDSEKPVVVFAHMLASAGVKGTLPAAEIIASGEGARIGSIGTYISMPKWLRQFYNDNFEDIYADASTNKNKEFRGYIAGDLSNLKQDLNRRNSVFQKEVSSFRQLKGKIDRTLSGELYFAEEAKRAGLIDGIGSFNYAVQRLAAIAADPTKAKTYAFRSGGELEIETIQENQKDEEMTWKDFINMIRNEVSEEDQQMQQDQTGEEDQNDRTADAIQEINAQILTVSNTISEIAAGVQTLTTANEATAAAIQEIRGRLDAIEARQTDLEGRQSDAETAVAQLKGRKARPAQGQKADVADYSATEKAFADKLGKPMW